MKTPRKKCTFSSHFPFYSTSFHIFSCQSNLTLSNARASRSCLIQVVFSSERLCGWGGGHICSAEASFGTYSRRVVTSQCSKEQRFRVCQSVTGVVDFHWRVLDRYPCYVNHIDIAVHLVCLQGRCTISTSPNRFEVSQRWRQGDRMPYLWHIHKYIHPNLESYHRNVGYQAISLLFSFPCQAILVLPRPCFVFCSGCWKRLPVCEKRWQVAMLCVGRQLHRRVLFNCNAWKILEEFVKGHKRGG